MLWLLDNVLKENYTFAQIFNSEKISIDSDTIYSLGKEINTKKINGIIPIKYSFSIKRAGKLISYTNLETGKTITFTKKENIIYPNENPNENPNKYLIFVYNYKLVDVHRLPIIKSDLYDNYYENISMDIYSIDNNTMYVHEKNISNNFERKYFIVKNYANFKF